MAINTEFFGEEIRKCFQGEPGKTFSQKIKSDSSISNSAANNQRGRGLYPLHPRLVYLDGVENGYWKGRASTRIQSKLRSRRWRNYSRGEAE